MTENSEKNGYHTHDLIFDVHFVTFIAFHPRSKLTNRNINEILSKSKSNHTILQ